ncbi:MAG TPA: DegV family protein [Gaiellaceae bacterium]|nr:DegV family protein [Gaiellaceae bacterium]
MKLTAANTAIVLDSTADFPEDRARRPSWRVVPLSVRFGDESFLDGVELGPDAFYERLAAAAEPPSTAAPAPGAFAAVYEELAAAYARVFSLHLPRTLSGTLGSAIVAARGFANVRVVDTGTVSAASAMLALALQRRLERGTSDEEVDALVERFRAEHGLLFTLETLDYLARGGRIGKAAALAGALLAVKPILTIRDGEVVPLRRVRGAQKAWDEFRSALLAGSHDAPSLRVGIVHAAAPERLAALERVVREARPRARVEVAAPLGAVLGAHAGPGAVGLFWFDDPEG